MMPVRDQKRQRPQRAKRRPSHTALVVGGAGGLGTALCARLREAGYGVVSVDLQPQEREPGFTPVTIDLADRAELDARLPELVARGAYDVAIFAAGRSATGRFETMPADALHDLIRVNAEAPLVMTAALLRSGALSKRICYISSLSHYVSYPGAAAYAAGKDAIAAYATAIRGPLNERGLTVTLACPGPIDTQMAERHAPEGAKRDGRMDADVAARAILRATMAGKAVVVPGLSSKFSALGGRLFPMRSAGTMKRIIYDQLDRDRW